MQPVVEQAQDFAEMALLMTAVARSEIVLPLSARLADWETTRNAADIDDVVLAWIASETQAKGRHFDA
jgi:hypothetical protein